jgi:hypothetical protein
VLVLSPGRDGLFLSCFLSFFLAFGDENSNQASSNAKLSLAENGRNGCLEPLGSEPVVVGTTERSSIGSDLKKHCGFICGMSSVGMMYICHFDLDCLALQMLIDRYSRTI